MTDQEKAITIEPAAIRPSYVCNPERSDFAFVWFHEKARQKKKHLQVREQSVDGVCAFRASETEFNKGTELFVTSTVIK